MSKHFQKDQEAKMHGMEKIPHKESHKDKEHFLDENNFGQPASYSQSAGQKLVDKFWQADQKIKPEFEGKHFKEFKDKFEYEGKHKAEKFEMKEVDKYPEGYGFGPGPVEQRLAALEEQIGKLQHFIPKEARPDMGPGALKDEKDLSGGQEASKKPNR
jgi:hypothetical protein